MRAQDTSNSILTVPHEQRQLQSFFISIEFRSPIDINFLLFIAFAAFFRSIHVASWRQSYANTYAVDSIEFSGKIQWIRLIEFPLYVGVAWATGDGDGSREVSIDANVTQYLFVFELVANTQQTCQPTYLPIGVA